MSIDSHSARGADHWSRTFRFHVLGLEFFLAAPGTFTAGVRRHMSAENTVYLAGMIARETDSAYLEQIRTYLVEDPEAMDQTVRRHDPYLGHNAPLVTISRINAEHLTLQFAGERGDGSLTDVVHLMVPAKYFGIASYYSLQAGNHAFARIFDFFRNHLSMIVDVLAGYLDYLEERAGVLPEEIPVAVWERLGMDSNERNRRKEFWEAAGINTSRKNRLIPLELREMLNYTQPN